MGQSDLRFRVARLIVQDVTAYLTVESEWQPYLNLVHTEEDTLLSWTYPEVANIPQIQINLREVKNDGA